MKRKADWSHSGGLVEIFKACQEITAGKGGRTSSCALIFIFITLAFTID